MSVQRSRPTATDDEAEERRVDVTGLPAGDLEEFVDDHAGEVYVERKRATYVVAPE